MSSLGSLLNKPCLSPRHGCQPFLRALRPHQAWAAGTANLPYPDPAPPFSVPTSCLKEPRLQRSPVWPDQPRNGLAQHYRGVLGIFFSFIVRLLESEDPGLVLARPSSARELHPSPLSVPLRQGLDKLPRLALNLGSSYINLQSSWDHRPVLHRPSCPFKGIHS